MIEGIIIVVCIFVAIALWLKYQLEFKMHRMTLPLIVSDSMVESEYHDKRKKLQELAVRHKTEKEPARQPLTERPPVANRQRNTGGRRRRGGFRI